MDASFIQKIRCSSRELIRELGFLSDGAKRWGIGHSACHALISLRTHKALNVNQLSDILRLEKSSSSRLVSLLVKKKLVISSSCDHDGRSKSLKLTKKADNFLSKMDAEVNEMVEKALESLCETDKEVILKGISLYVKGIKRARNIIGISISKIKSCDGKEVGQLVRDILPEFGGDKPGFAFMDPELDYMAEQYMSPGWCYFVAKKDDQILGGGGIGPLEGADKGICELKKMYFYPEGRGLGLGKKVLKACIDEAQDLGYEKCYLETLEGMHHAKKLYEKFGFISLAGPMGSTGHHGCDTWYVLDLK
ncbi:MAG: MarR family transcriptional regulator [Bacteriovoracaceae bacterium]|jgi:putative acetyltransferase|nr:MarR family transcriptional regulator [Bacteriovoracaceae bacterium]